MSWMREMFTIAKARENKNGKTYWKGVIDMNGKKVSITVWPSSDGSNAKISAWPWSAEGNRGGGGRSNYRR